MLVFYSALSVSAPCWLEKISCLHRPCINKLRYPCLGSTTTEWKLVLKDSTDGFTRMAFLAQFRDFGHVDRVGLDGWCLEVIDL